MWEIVRTKLEKARRDQGISYDALGDHLGYSHSTVHRWLEDPDARPQTAKPCKKTAPPYDVVVDMAAFLHCDIQEINAAVGAKELQVSQDIGYMGTDALLHQFQLWKDEHAAHTQAIVDHHTELRLLDAAHHATMLAKLDAELAYLKDQVRRFRAATIIFLVAFVAVLLICLSFLLFDIPSLGAGGSILTPAAYLPHLFPISA